MDLAERLDRLGTETAFAVSAAAAEWAARGNRVYPFHLGDINLPTPANIVDAMNQAIADGKTGYSAAAGIAPLRDTLAANIGSDRGIELGGANIVVQPGGKPVITKFIQTLMNPGEGVLYPNPGYPIYESQICYYGGKPLPYRYHETPSGFGIDLDQLRELAPQARLLIYNDLQNPLGCESSAEEMAEIATLADEHDLWVMSDEAYFEMRYSGTTTSIASLPGMAERTVILYTFSKKFAMTGWRLGCAAAPVRVAEQIAKLNTNDESCTTHFVQAAGVEAFRDPSGSVPILAELERRRDAAIAALANVPGIHCAKPEATFYLFPNVTEAVRRTGFESVTDFATAALHNTGVSFCTRHHFGSAQPGETEHYIRLAYSGISAEDITEGIGRLAEWVAAVVTARIAVLGRIPASGLEVLHQAGDVWSWDQDEHIPDDVRNEQLATADAAVTLLTNKVDDAFLDAAPNLRIVANVAVGFNNVDVTACARRGVLVSNTPGVLADATADLAMTLILMVTRRMAEGERLIRSGEPWAWGMFMMLGTSVQGRQLGIIGMGGIGEALAKRARAFGMNVVYHNRRPVAPEVAAHLDAQRLELDELLATSDVVSVNCPYNPDTHHLIDAAALQRMKSSAFLVNTARGPIVDESALVDGLRAGEIAGAALDVFEHEPQVHPGLLELDNAVLVPHLGSATVETRGAMAELAARNVVAVLAGRDPLTPVGV